MSKPKESKNMLVGLDIGTSKIVAIVAEVLEDGQLNIVGMGHTPSRGLKRGMVVNIESTVQAIQRALEEAELMADCKIHEVFVGIAGSHIKSVNSHGMVAIKDREVTKMDIDRVIETARAVTIPPDHQVLHILTQEYSIDGQEGVREPLGMSGVRLEAKVHIVTGAVSAAQNVTKCVRRCGLEVSDLVLQPMASAIAVLSEDEKDLGVCLIDIGGGTTDIAVYVGGAIRHTAVIPIAGDQITNDIAMALRTPTKEAEDIKIQHGVSLVAMADPAQMIEVPGVGERGPRQMSRATLAEVIEPRVEELFQLVQQELRRSGFEELLSSGMVLTGGASLMPGMVELAEEVFHLPVRVGVPKYVGGLAEVVKTPRFSTGVGLLLYGKDQIQGYAGPHSKAESAGVGQLFGKMKAWFAGNF
ncbi:cell division protein FtsA [Chromobacterium subtsugae]|uniref:Cell division protein FtsA n=2 Tax=Chromobacteriaceae TaxID=1499392 RepID=A0ABS7F8E6_9NEIS|nr:cell division protein FtsA [Chromobacterium subtsugae]KZE86660.1 cell division protein FtsA [Chromobacterium sp. F49]KUM03733.1 cell division protein FtsA [Chromobacterium subtsugae]MBW7565108.1 cell division protein FtsA [Chromobacterium subtsugae]MBW8286364.1 cell division protein FtsA [Chromobacterium subtsugae]OBU87775.1 cell division protein FtsA [Chromobacterium subtsugae]